MFESDFNQSIQNFLNEIEKNLVRKTKRMKVLESQK
jgi:hypothetical protein